MKQSSDKYKKVLEVFRKNYKPIPLEVFKKDPYKTLLSTMLSSRTKDEVTLEASKRLFKKAPNMNAIKKLGNDELEKLIYPVGFYKTKAQQLLKLAEIVLKSYSGKVPKTREDLMKLPGVGRKTANLTMNRAFNTPAIAVDTHVHKISNILSWVNTKSPEQTEKELIRILPRKYWPEINRLFVSIGRQFNSKKKLLEFLKNEDLTKKK